MEKGRLANEQASSDFAPITLGRVASSLRYFSKKLRKCCRSYMSASCLSTYRCIQNHGGGRICCYVITPFRNPFATRSVPTCTPGPGYLTSAVLIQRHQSNQRYSSTGWNRSSLRR